jgi:hypothetical protein
MSEGTWKSGVFGSIGVYIRSIEQYLYNFPSCIKHMKPAEQIKKIAELGPGSKTVSDYSSYEASFSREVQDSSQFNNYKHMTQLLSEGDDFFGHATWAYGTGHCITSKMFTAVVWNLKCSGDFDTSLSNYKDNSDDWLTVFSMVHGVHWSDAMDWILCEGDDNLSDDHGLEMKKEHFAKLGMTAKIETNLELETAGLCQKFINPQTLNLLGDPIRYLGKSVFIPACYAGSKQRKKLELARAKAMSTLATYPNAPVISEHAWKIYQSTQGISISKSAIERAKKYGQELSPKQVFSKPVISDEDRLLVSDQFDFTLEQQAQFLEFIAKWDPKTVRTPYELVPRIMD